MWQWKCDRPLRCRFIVAPLLLLLLLSIAGPSAFAEPGRDGRLIRLEDALIGKCHLNLKAAIFIVSFDGESTTTNSSKVQSSCFLFQDGRDSDLTEELPSFPPLSTSPTHHTPPFSGQFMISWENKAMKLCLLEPVVIVRK